jgi:hypothetical protein
MPRVWSPALGVDQSRSPVRKTVKPTCGSSHGVSVSRVSVPAQRTVGQLVADSVRLYGDRFWRGLLLGVPPAVLAVLLGDIDYGTWLALMTTVGALGLTVSYIGASALAAQKPLDRRMALALVAGVLAFLPVPLLVLAFILPAVAWLAFVGLVVPVIVIERRSLRDGFRRAIELARADYIHALGSLATLVIVVLLTQSVLFFLLRGTGEQTVRIAAFLANLVVSPVLFLGAALLYFDQVARHDERHARAVPRR